MSILAAGLRRARTERWTSASLGILAAVVCLATLTTFGRTAAQERAILAAFADSGAHVFTIDVPVGAVAIPADRVTIVGQLSHVQWVAAVGATVDVRPSTVPGAEPVAAVAIMGALPGLTLAGPQLAGGGAFVSQQSQTALGFAAAAGSVTTADGEVLSVAGTFTVDGDTPVDLAGYVLLSSPSPQFAVSKIVVGVDDPDVIAVVSRAAYQVLGGGPLAVSEPDELVQARRVVAGEVGRYGRGMLLLILGAGLVFAAVAVYLHTSARRRDFGRMRAIGATRLDLLTLVLVSSLAAALPGVVIGTAAGAVIAGWGSAEGLGWQVPAAIGVLVLITFAAAAAPIALVAAWRDPVVALRVP